MHTQGHGDANIYIAHNEHMIGVMLASIGMYYHIRVGRLSSPSSARLQEMESLVHSGHLHTVFIFLDHFHKGFIGWRLSFLRSRKLLDLPSVPVGEPTAPSTSNQSHHFRLLKDIISMLMGMR